MRRLATNDARSEQVPPGEHDHLQTTLLAGVHFHTDDAALQWVKAAFDGVPSFSHQQWVTKNEPYTPEAAALRAGLRSGQALVLNFTTPCPQPTKVDCAAVWLAWGECEADGSGRVMRYTVERDAVAGGAECPHDDGYSEKHPC